MLNISQLYAIIMSLDDVSVAENKIDYFFIGCYDTIWNHFSLY